MKDIRCMKKLSLINHSKQVKAEDKSKRLVIIKLQGGNKS